MSNELKTPNEHLENVQHITKDIVANKAHELNLADPKQLEYVKGLYKMNGLTPERYPKTFADLEAHHQADIAAKKVGAPQLNTAVLQEGETGFGTLAMITNVGTANNGANASTTAFLSVDGGATAATLILDVYDVSNRAKPIRITTKTIVVGTTDFVAIEATGGVPTTKMMATLTYKFTPIGGVPTKMNVISAYNVVNQADPIVNEPVQKPTHLNNPNIKIALSRGDFGRNNDDVDYWFNKDNKLPTTTVIVPFVGQVTFKEEIVQPLQDNLELQLFVALQDGGVSTIPDNFDAVKKAFSVDPDGKTLRWNLPANGANPGSEGNPIIYGEAPWGSDTVTYFFANIGVKTGTNVNYSWAFVQSTDSSDETPDDGVHFIKPLQFLWHCLAKGTLVTLANGEQMPIEDVDNNQEVLVNRNGESLRVMATTRGRARQGEVLRIQTNVNEELILSKGHVVITANGPLLAEELAVGDVLVGLEGDVKIVAINDANEYNGLLYNLILDAEENPSVKPYFFANLIQVADYEIQMNYKKNASKNKSYVLSKLPNEWHTDYLSSLEDGHH